MGKKKYSRRLKKRPKPKLQPGETPQYTVDSTNPLFTTFSVTSSTATSSSESNPNFCVKTPLDILRDDYRKVIVELEVKKVAFDHLRKMVVRLFLTISMNSRGGIRNVYEPRFISLYRTLFELTGNGRFYKESLRLAKEEEQKIYPSPPKKYCKSFVNSLFEWLP